MTHLHYIQESLDKTLWSATYSSLYFSICKAFPWSLSAASIILICEHCDLLSKIFRHHHWLFLAHYWLIWCLCAQRATHWEDLPLSTILPAHFHQLDTTDVESVLQVWYKREISRMTYYKPQWWPSGKAGVKLPACSQSSLQTWK